MRLNPLKPWVVVSPTLKLLLQDEKARLASLISDQEQTLANATSSVTAEIEAAETQMRQLRMNSQTLQGERATLGAAIRRKLKANRAAIAEISKLL